MVEVVQLDPDADPRIGSLYDRLRAEVYDSAEGTKITVAEVLGTLDLLKYDLIKELKDD